MKQKENESSSCQVCFVKNIKTFRYNQYIQCYVCHKTAHRYCYHPISKESQFMCDECNYNSKTAQQCFICGNTGLLKRVQNNFAHPLCMLFSPYFLVESYQSLNFIQIEYSKHQQEYSIHKCQLCGKCDNLLKCYAQCQTYAHMYCLWKSYKPTTNQGWIHTTIFQQNYSFQDFYLNSLKRYLKLKQSVALQFINKFVSKSSKIKIERPVYEVSCQGHLNTIFHCCTNLKFLNEENLEWVFCEQCCRWYHQKCVLGKRKLKENQDFICKGCLQFEKLVIKQNLQDINLKDLPRLNICELIYIQVMFESKSYKLSLNQKQLLFKLPVYPSKKYAQEIIKEKISEKMISQISFNSLKKKIQYQNTEFIQCFKSKQIQRMLQLVEFVISKELVQTQQDDVSIIEDFASNKSLQELAKSIIFLLKSYEQKYTNGRSSLLTKIIKKLQEYLNKNSSQDEQNQSHLEINLSSSSYKEQKNSQKSNFLQSQYKVKLKSSVKKLLKQIKSNPKYLGQIKNHVKIMQNLINKNNINEKSTQFANKNRRSILQGFLHFNNTTDIASYMEIRFLLWNYCQKKYETQNSQNDHKNEPIQKQIKQNTINKKTESRKNLKQIIQVYENSSQEVKNHFKNQIRLLDIKQSQYDPNYPQDEILSQHDICQMMPSNLELLSLNKKLRNAIFDFSSFKDLETFKKYFSISENTDQQDLLKVLTQKKLIYELKSIDFTRQSYLIVKKKLQGFCLIQNADGQDEAIKDFKQKLFLGWLDIYQTLQSFADLFQKYKKKLLQNYGIEELKSKEAIQILSEQQANNQDMLGNILKFLINMRGKKIKYARYHQKLLKTILKIFQNIIPILKQYKELWLSFQQTYLTVKQLVFKISKKQFYQYQKLSFFLQIFKTDEIELEKLSFTELSFESPKKTRYLSNILQNSQKIYQKMKIKFRVDKIRICKIWIQIFQLVLSKINPYYVIQEEYMDQVQIHNNRITIYQLQNVLKLMTDLKFPQSLFKTKLKTIYTEILQIKSKFNSYFNACNWEFSLQNNNFSELNYINGNQKDKVLQQNFNKFYHKERKIDLKKIQEVIQKAKMHPIVSFQLQIAQIEAVIKTFCKVAKQSQKLLKVQENFAANNFQKLKSLSIQLIKHPFLFDKIGEFQVQLTRQWVINENEKKKTKIFQTNKNVRNIQEEYFNLINTLQCQSNSNNQQRCIFRHNITKTLDQLDAEWRKQPKLHRNHLIAQYKQRIVLHLKNFYDIYQKFKDHLNKYKKNISLSNDEIVFTIDDLITLQSLFYDYQFQKIRDPEIEDMKISYMIYKNSLSAKLIDSCILRFTLLRIKALPQCFCNELIEKRKKQIQILLKKFEEGNIQSNGKSEYLDSGNYRFDQL